MSDAVPSSWARRIFTATASLTGASVVVVLLAAGHEVGHSLLAIAVVVAIARLLGSLGKRLGQPSVIGEIVGGVVLGPSVLGWLWPAAHSWMFSAQTLEHLRLPAELGLVYFMFLIGFHFRLRALRDRWPAIMSISNASIAVPFATGLLIAGALPVTLMPDGTSSPYFSLFIGIAFSVTAFPVLARILADRRLLHTPLGVLALACAAVIDLLAWLAIALLAGLFQADGIHSYLFTLCGFAVLIALLALVVRPLAHRISRTADGDRLLIATALVGAPIAALATHHIGLHLAIGAFLLGVAFPSEAAESRRVHQSGRLLTAFLLPLFFALIGLRTDLGALNADPSLWAWTAALLGAAMLSKLAGTAVGARCAGIGRRGSATLGVLLSCRGLTELVVLDIGRTLGLLTPVLFTMLVVVATVSTVLTGPLLGLAKPKPAEPLVAPSRSSRTDREE